MDYKEDLKIDKYSLDEEWEHQPQIYMEYSQLQAEWEIKKDRLKDLIEIEKAQLERDIRTYPEDYYLSPKPTNDAIKAIVNTDNKINQLKRRYFHFLEKTKIYAAVTRTLDHKKKALENLVMLHLAGYYSQPNIIDKAKENSRFDFKKKINKMLSEKDY